MHFLARSHLPLCLDHPVYRSRRWLFPVNMTRWEGAPRLNEDNSMRIQESPPWRCMTESNGTPVASSVRVYPSPPRQFAGTARVLRHLAVLNTERKAGLTAAADAALCPPCCLTRPDGCRCVVISMLSGQSLRASVPVMGGGGLLGLFCVAAVLFLSLIPFFAFEHLRRTLARIRSSIPDSRCSALCLPLAHT